MGTNNGSTIKDVNVIAILDMTGSMWGKEEDTRGGFNSFVEQAKADQAQEGGKVTVTLVCFDRNAGRLSLQRPFDRVPVQDVRMIGPADYTPRGDTPLFDAIGHTLSPLSFPKEEAVMVIITTDGEENASQEWSGDQVRALITEKEAAGWEFMFLGVGLDAFKASAGFATAAMRGSTISTPSTGAAAAAASATAGATAYRAVRRGQTVRHAVGTMYAGGSEYDDVIDRTRPDQRGEPEPDKAPDKAATTTQRLRDLRRRS